MIKSKLSLKVGTPAVAMNVITWVTVQSGKVVCKTYHCGPIYIHPGKWTVSGGAYAIEDVYPVADISTGRFEIVPITADAPLTKELIVEVQAKNQRWESAP